MDRRLDAAWDKGIGAVEKGRRDRVRLKGFRLVPQLPPIGGERLVDKVLIGGCSPVYMRPSVC